MSEVEFYRLSNVARMRVYASSGRCFICSYCNYVYLTELSGIVPLGFFETRRLDAGATRVERDAASAVRSPGRSQD
jgi:hypothetical protein